MIKILPLVFIFAFVTACSHKKTTKDGLSKKSLSEKTVALAQIKAGPETKKQVELSLINEIIEKGRFKIVEKSLVEDALVHYPTEGDWQRLGKKVGADFVLSLNVLDYAIQDYQGYDKSEEEDSVMTEEYRSKKPIKSVQYKKVKNLEGKVRIRFTLFDVAEDNIAYEGIGLAEKQMSSRDQSLPRKMKLLEELSTLAVTDFFESLK